MQNPMSVAMADPMRSRLLVLISGNPLTIDELAEALGTSASIVTTHLVNLQAVGLVAPTRRARCDVLRRHDSAWVRAHRDLGG